MEEVKTEIAKKRRWARLEESATQKDDMDPWQINLEIISRDNRGGLLCIEDDDHREVFDIYIPNEKI